MPRKSNPIPSYLLHKQSGQARVRVQGRDVLLGPFNSPESRQRYAEILTQLAAGRPVSVPGGLRGVPAGDPGVTVNELVVAFLQHADGHDGRYVLGRETLSHASCDHGRTFTVKGQALVDWDSFPRSRWWWSARTARSGCSCPSQGASVRGSSLMVA